MATKACPLAAVAPAPAVQAELMPPVTIPHMTPSTVQRPLPTKSTIIIAESCPFTLYIRIPHH